MTSFLNGMTRRLLMGQDAPWSGQFAFVIDSFNVRSGGPRPSTLSGVMRAGGLIGHFMEVSGLSVSIEDEKIVEGGQNEYVRRVPGRMTWPNLVLKRGVVQNDALFEWLRRCSGEGFEGAQGKVERHTAYLLLLGPTLAGIGPLAIREPIRAWSFYDAFPVRWSGPTLSTSSKDIATETLEIAHHGFRNELP